jgi:hypothetical protein
MKAKVQAVETSYHVRKGPRGRYVGESLHVVEVMFKKHHSETCDEDWVVNVNGPESISREGLERLIAAHYDWPACAGTKPVCVDGQWGGRNYSKLVVPFVELSKLLGLFDEERELRRQGKDPETLAAHGIEYLPSPYKLKDSAPKYDFDAALGEGRR